MKALRKSHIVLALIVLAYLVYAGLFIYRTSFVVGGERFFALFDDAMISMRYAKNLAHGYGLVWNPGGERVEGYTNLLWVLYMAVFHLLPVAPSKMSLFIQISGALFLLTNLLFVKKMADFISGGSTLVSMGAALLTAFYLPLNNWSLQGMEVSVLTLVTSVTVWKTLQGTQSNRFSIWLYILFGIGTIIRMDMAVPFVVTVIFLLVTDSQNRSKHLFGALLVTILILLQTLFRLRYYGDVLPNTYYLKMVGYPSLSRISRGVWVFLNFIWEMNWALALIPFSMLLFRRDKAVLFLFSVLLAQAAYSIYVGGDAWESWGGSNRYISIVMPIFFVLFSAGLVKSGSLLIERTTGLTANHTRYVLIVLILMSLVNFNAIRGPEALLEWLLVKPPYRVVNNQRMVERGFVLTKITTDQAKIAVVSAGITPYFCDRYAIDLLGKSDRRIAHENMRVFSDPTDPISKFTSFYPGHLKWSYGYSIGELEPDVVVQLWWSPEEAQPYLESSYREVRLHGISFYLLDGSNNILWDKVSSGEMQ